MKKHYLHEFLTDDRRYIKKQKRSKPLESKELFYEILQEWAEWNDHLASENPKIGDVPTGNTRLIHLDLNNSRYYLNGDTNLSGVKEFLRNMDSPWKIIPNNRGRMNKVTNDKEGSGITGFFLYKEL
ncbi:hypothetical protein [Robiginitalea biformata]|uniref:Uncharacterized protein n=1 Tax=Robiginitalea biformata (strain ATCC BAA-864 / DSM 15991 / KCTC 12146 / HTCC2501) TaxID=313596 RepID=A4CHR5_ROBBH|nr:hypothetical protein [Robiginitalea biformata]EAR16473.1 hypothetical protein RB2501_06225 [Robiginitalea biformata HTCC2501]